MKDQSLLYIAFLSLLYICPLTPQTNIAVVDFIGKGVSEQEASALSDRLRTELFLTGSFTVLERELMEQILTEQDFQLTGCTTDECVLEIGALIGVTQMVAGSISKVGQTFSVTARLISIESGEILHVAVYDYQGEIDDLLMTGMGIVAQQLAGGDADYTPSRYDREPTRGFNWGKFAAFSLPDEAAVTLRIGREIILNGKTPFRSNNLVPRAYSAILSRAGYWDWRGDVEIQKNKTTYIQIALHKKPLPLNTLSDLGFNRKPEKKEEISGKGWLIYFIGGTAIMVPTAFVQPESPLLAFVGVAAMYLYVRANYKIDVPIEENIRYNKRILETLAEKNRPIKEENDRIKQNNSSLPEPIIEIRN